MQYAFDHYPGKLPQFRGKSFLNQGQSRAETSTVSLLKLRRWLDRA